MENRPAPAGVVGYEIASRAQLPTATRSHVDRRARHDVHHSRQASVPSCDRFSRSRESLVALCSVLSSNSPATSVKELIELARTSIGKLNYGSPGNGTAQHLTTELLKKRTGVDMVHVPYKSGAGAVNAVLAGEVQLFFAGLPPALPHVKTARLRALAVTSPRGFRSWPNVATLAEAGLPVSRSTMARYHRAGENAKAARRQAERGDRAHARYGRNQTTAAGLGRGSEPSTSEELRQLLRSEVVKWNEAARAAGLRP